MTPESSPEVFAPHERVLPALLRRRAERLGSRPLVKMRGLSWSYAEARDVAAQRGAALRASAVKRGDRVALLCSNRAEFLEVFLGCGWIGAISVPINTAAREPQIRYYLANSGATLLVIEDEFVPRLAGADLSGTSLQAIWIVGESAPPGGELAGVRCREYPSAKEPVDPEPVRPGDPLTILYTSGTTGPAKGVVCPHGQYHAWGVNSVGALGIVESDVLGTTLPLFHINALSTFAQACVAGCRVVFEPRFSASGFWPAMQEAQASVIYLLGAMVPILLAQPAHPAERNHSVRIGLGPGVPEAAGAAFLARTGVLLLEGYGSTETNFVIATAVDSPRRGVMGWLRPGFQGRVVNECDVELPAGKAGELVLRADEPFAFASGYFGMPEKTVEAWRNLWFHTGDRVVRDADGAFRFIDRIKDSIRRRGENISSWEVEQVLLTHPRIAQAAVYAVRSDLAEDEVMAALVPKLGETIDPAEVVRFCAERLPKYAVPRYIDVRAELPRTESGKVQKYQLREQGVGPMTWERREREP